MDINETNKLAILASYRKRKVKSTSTYSNRPKHNRIREKFFLPSSYFLPHQKSLEGIIRILKRASSENSDLGNFNQRYSYYAGFSTKQRCDAFEQLVQNTKLYLDN